MLYFLIINTAITYLLHNPSPITNSSVIERTFTSCFTPKNVLMTRRTKPHWHRFQKMYDSQLQAIVQYIGSAHQATNLTFLYFNWGFSVVKLIHISLFAFASLSTPTSENLSHNDKKSSELIALPCLVLPWYQLEVKIELKLSINWTKSKFKCT